jgi:hypothetical protein
MSTLKVLQQNDILERHFEEKKEHDWKSEKYVMQKAGSDRDIIQSFRLLYDQYLELGYTMPTREKILYGVHHLLKVTQIYTFLFHEKVGATITLIRDSEEFGLPLDATYLAEVDQLRKSGRKVAEVCYLASSRERKCRHAVLYLQQKVILASIAEGYDDLCFTVNPKHVSFYKKMYPSEVFGPERFYERVKAPAVLIRIDLRMYHRHLLKTTPKLVEKKNNSMLLATGRLKDIVLVYPGLVIRDGQAYSPSDKLTLKLLKKHPDMLASLTTHQRSFFCNELKCSLQ